MGEIAKELVGKLEISNLDEQSSFKIKNFRDVSTLIGYKFSIPDKLFNVFFLKDNSDFLQFVSFDAMPINNIKQFDGLYKYAIDCDIRKLIITKDNRVLPNREYLNNSLYEKLEEVNSVPPLIVLAAENKIQIVDYIIAAEPYYLSYANNNRFLPKKSYM